MKMKWLPLACACGTLLIASPAQAQTISQTLVLRPGWNSVHLEVEPGDNEPARVFAGVSVESVWTFSSRLTAVDFIQDPNEPLWNRSSWRVWVPTNHPGAFQNSLFKIFGNRPYLINLTSAAPVSLVITGRPSFRPLEWVPDSYNLRGFPVDPANRPSFFNFFRYSAAHYTAANAQLNKIYRLSPTGQWTLVSGSDLMEYGVAYWVFTRGGSEFQAPLGLKVDFGDGLNYGAILTEQTISLANQTPSAKNVTILDLGAPCVAPLSYPNPDPVGANRWLDVPSPFAFQINAAQSIAQRLAIRRKDMASVSCGTVLEIKDGQGTRWRVPLTASKSVAPTPSGTPPPAPVLEARNRAGLWVGNVSLDAVSEVNAGPLFTNESHAITRVSGGSLPPVTYDFNSGLPAGTAVYGNAFVSNGVLELTHNAPSQQGTFIIPDLAPGQTVAGFTASLRARVFYSTGGFPADGWSFNWAADLPNTFVGEDGGGSGLTISFDTYDNGGGEGPAVDALWGGVLLARYPAPFLRTTNTSFVDVKIRVYPNGKLDVTYGGQAIFSQLTLPGFSSLTGARFGLGARTGGAWETHSIDDLSITLFPKPSAVPTTPTRTEMTMRLLMHVDTNGTARLLKDVIQMWKNGTYTNDADGNRVTETAGRYVLLTDDSLIGSYSGAALRDGQPVGRRLSTASYDWHGTNTFVPMSGNFAIGHQLGCTLSLQPNTPTNPFRHRYHPDHDNLDVTFMNYKEEAYGVTRQIELTLTPTDPTQFSSADYGYTVVGGTYRETITGLHKDSLVTSGTFRLTRVANIGVLNQ